MVVRLQHMLLCNGSATHLGMLVGSPACVSEATAHSLLLRGPHRHIDDGFINPIPPVDAKVTGRADGTEKRPGEPAMRRTSKRAPAMQAEGGGRDDPDFQFLQAPSELEELPANASYQDFLRYLDGNHPVLLKGVASPWPCSRAWTDASQPQRWGADRDDVTIPGVAMDALAASFGRSVVPVTVCTGPGGLGGECNEMQLEEYARWWKGAEREPTTYPLLYVKVRNLPLPCTSAP